MVQELENSGGTATQVACVCCEQTRIDSCGIIRVLDYERRCHLCHDSLTKFETHASQVIDDVTDHDLYHC